MWKEVLFGVDDWQKLTGEINKLDQIMAFEDQSKLDKIKSLKDDIKFFQDNIERIYANCLDTDYVRIKQAWVEIKHHTRKNMEDIYIGKIQNIIRTLNLSIQDPEPQQIAETEEKIVIIRPKKIKIVLYIILFIMILNLLIVFYKYNSVIVARMQ